MFGADGAISLAKYLLEYEQSMLAHKRENFLGFDFETCTFS
jgi:hypothetical protein